MTDPDSRPAPPRPPDPKRRFPAWLLGLALSFILLAGWLTYLRMAPTPGAAPQAVPATTTPTPAPTGIKILVWRNALEAGVLADFESETGIKVSREGFDTSEQLTTLLDGGHFDYDLVLVSGVDARRLLDRDLLAPVPDAAIPNRVNVDGAAITRAGVYDLGNRFTVPLLWGTLGLAFDSDKVQERLGADAAVDSWSVLFDPTTAAKLATCGIQVVDSPRGVFPIALTYLGLPVDSAKAEDTEAATRAWEAVRPSIGKFASADVADALAEGRVCLALATSGDAAMARMKAQAGAEKIRYVLPKEGTISWYALLGIPKSATNAGAAAKLMDYLLRPQVAARLSNADGLPNAVRDSALYIRPELTADTAIFPPADAALKFVLESEPSAAAQALRSRFWQLINTPPAAPAAPPAPAPAQPQ